MPDATSMDEGKRSKVVIMSVAAFRSWLDGTSDIRVLPYVMPDP